MKILATLIATTALAVGGDYETDSRMLSNAYARGYNYMNPQVEPVTEVTVIVVTPPTTIINDIYPITTTTGHIRRYHDHCR